MLLQEMKRGRQLVKKVERKEEIKEPVKEIVELKDRRRRVQAELTWDQSLLLYTVKTSRCSRKQLFRKSDPILYVQ